MYISKDGKLRFSTSDFKKSRTICLADRGEKAPRLHHQKKMKEVCSCVRYVPTSNNFAVCGKTSQSMIYGDFSYELQTRKLQVSKHVYKTSGKDTFITCAEFSPISKYLMVGDTKGLIVILSPNNMKSKLFGHKASITHILYNSLDKVFVSISADKNIRIWSDVTFDFNQSFFPENMKTPPVTAVCYNTYNKELLLANTDIAKCFGRATDLFYNTSTSHNMPLCSVIYQDILKQVVSVCQNGVVTAWDLFTGTANMHFKITSEDSVKNILMSFDPSKRRLVIAAQDGKVKIWNVNSGKVVNVYDLNIMDVSGLVCDKKYIFIFSKTSNKIIAISYKFQNL
uniref:WD repeat-containing protein on Y chromosome n=1 Tax=Kryptolebias marmoratus TaxID=37003 RepID=A0A3Q3AL03_KRYMA